MAVIAGGRARAYTPKRTQDAEDEIAMMARIACPEPSTEPCRVTLEFRSMSKRQADLDNLVKLVLDALNGVVYADDSQVIELHAVLNRATAPPGTDIRVELGVTA